MVARLVGGCAVVRGAIGYRCGDEFRVQGY